jgi:hypothetical protein
MDFALVKVEIHRLQGPHAGETLGQFADFQDLAT